jgi:hypothetical protein
MTGFERRLLQLLVFLGFFPYPAVTQIGNTTGIQISDLLVWIILVLTLPTVLQSTSSRAYAFLVMPIFISLGALTFFSGTGDPGLGIRVTITTALSLLMLPAAGSLMQHARAECLVPPVSMAICIHAIVGVWQNQAFASGTFPLSWIFKNASFANLQTIDTSYALYVARPFGLFPEPSAMAAALGPWVLFLLWYGLKPTVKWRVRALVGAASGTLLILLSQSIYAIFLLPCLFLILVLHRRTSIRRLSVLELLAWALSGLGAILFPIISAGRLNATNDSTLGRWSSLIEGIRLPFSNLLSVFFGVGPGQSANALAAQHSSQAAIYSVVVSAFAEGGLIALIGMICVWIMCLERQPAGFKYIFLFAWVAGIAFSTSYISLGPVWLFLAMILDLEFKSESSPRNTDFGIGRSGATFGVAGNRSEQKGPIQRRSIHAAPGRPSDGSSAGRWSTCPRIQDDGVFGS